MIGYLNLILRLVIWFLLTANLSVANIIIGVSVALLLPGRLKSPGTLKDWLRAIGEALVAIPQAYFEALQIMLFPHQHEDVTLERVRPGRTPGLIFLDVFIITFTPKTIVLKYHEKGWYEVHWVKRRKAS
ncbi:Na+/H+ antiporter subunit E [Mastigocoleus testarum]|uniref:Cation:proton antiporter n=1 Tax=Mastigocoleus testarum BC008 TaxID=371196 RepID=A0A0V7ZYF1_9CYAN|nr:Na+/H+ antiporter subunit E [Mastigocoleus testarum]KST69577.1 cation:proton antiporter [Mastigocoleus testarum BC008]